MNLIRLMILAFVTSAMSLTFSCGTLARAPICPEKYAPRTL